MSNNTPILVTGAAGSVGSVGRSVVKLLRERDLPVRALVHRLDERSQALSEMGAELVVADLTNGADVVRALHGCKRMYFGMSISPPYLQATVIAAAATKEIVDFEVFVNISQMSLTEMTKSPQQQQHWLAEQVLNWSGVPEVPVVHVRSTIFIKPFFSSMAASSIAKDGTRRFPFGSDRTALNRSVKYVDVPYDKWLKEEHMPVGLSQYVLDHISTMAKLHAENRYDRLTS
ncbi:MAG TPA: NAD(P)H-binding protein, partial [Ktedonobacteraceae bacterium]|nr:NAD(P)H-binding protein [Ktedonobacteraceae bacterium]